MRVSGSQPAGPGEPSTGEGTKIGDDPLQRLENLSRQYQSSQLRTETLRVERLAMLVRAYRGQASLGAMARACNLSKTRVRQILQAEGVWVDGST